MNRPAIQVPGHARGICRSCKAAVIWVKTVNGKSMPLDLEEMIGKGLVLFTIDAKGVAHQAPEGTPGGEVERMTVLLREALTIATTLGHEWGEEQARWLLSHGLTVARDAPSEAAAVVHQESWICGFCGKAGDPSDGPLPICISHLERA